MKKLLYGACMIFGAIFSANAQLPYLQNFETTMTTIPTNWNGGVATYHTKNPGWTFNNVFPTKNNSLFKTYTPAHTYCAFVDDIDYDYTGSSWANNTPTLNYDTLYTGVFNCSAAAHVFLSFDYNFNNYTGGEVATVAVSNDGGHTWTTAVSLPQVNDVSWYNGQIFDITATAGNQANVMVAFTWNNAGAVSQGYCGWGLAIDNVDVYAAASYDLSTTGQNVVQYLVKPLSNNSFGGTIFNYGYTSITSMNMNYSVNGGPAQTKTISGISGFNSLTSYNWSMPTPVWSPSSAGTYAIKFWADNINGSNVDGNHQNDTLTQEFLVLDTIAAKTVVLEEFNQASCDPCAEAKANVDSVCATNTAIMVPIRYHVNWPGTDYMNNETQTPFIGARVSYYGVGGVPDGKLDGMDIYPGAGYLTSAAVQGEAALGSPFKITITSATYDPSTTTYSLNANIKAFAGFAAGLTAQTVLTVDTINYIVNQSTETIPQYNFPQVAEDMMPGSNGTTLGSFTAGQTQTVSVSWKRNHPWGISPKAHVYDSTPGVHLTIFIQDNAGIPALGIPAQYVIQEASSWIDVPTGMEEISYGVYFGLFPNPSTGDSYVQFSLTNEQNVTVELYNMLGEKVYGDNQGKMSSGDHMITIPGSNLKAGVYFVKFTTDNSTTTKRLVIQK